MKNLAQSPKFPKIFAWEREKHHEAFHVLSTYFVTHLKQLVVIIFSSVYFGIEEMGIVHRYIAFLIFLGLPALVDLVGAKAVPLVLCDCCLQLMEIGLLVQ